MPPRQACMVGSLLLPAQGPISLLEPDIKALVLHMMQLDPGRPIPYHNIACAVTMSGCTAYVS
jgi:hypothetical protein